RSRLRSLQESTVHTAVVDQLPKAILSLNRVPRRTLIKRLCDADIRDLAEQQVRRDRRDVASNRHVQHDAAFLAHLSCPETTMRTAADKACVDVGDLLRVAGVPSAPFCVFVVNRLPLFGTPSVAPTFRKCHLRRSFLCHDPRSPYAPQAAHRVAQGVAPVIVLLQRLVFSSRLRFLVPYVRAHLFDQALATFVYLEPSRA